jgi:hypothetical protein
MPFKCPLVPLVVGEGCAGGRVDFVVVGKFLEDCVGLLREVYLKADIVGSVGGSLTLVSRGGGWRGP